MTRESGRREPVEGGPERDGTDGPVLSPRETRRLLHELQTHQVELELQNEELRRAQEELIDSRDRYSDLFDFAPVGYLTLDHKGWIVEANLTMADMLILERSALVNSPFSTFVSHCDQDIFYRHRREILKSNQRGTCHLRMVRRNAEPLWAEIVSAPLKASDNGEFHLRLIVRDITERKRAETEKQTLESQLQHAQKLESLGVLAGGIAHDFNNLLMVILGHASLALESIPKDSEAHASIHEIEKASRRSAELANQMLAYSGHGRFVVESVDIGKLVEEMAHMLEVAISKKVTLEYKYAEDLPTIDGDATQIRQVIMNLITNASEAIGDETGVITLSTGAIECDRDYLEDMIELSHSGENEPPYEGLMTFFEVSDCGCGMDSKTLERIFDPFFTTKFMGRGLGMSAVIGIIRGHRGALKIHSKVGEGTTFRVLFPANEGAGKPRENPTVEDRKKWRGGGTVLLVDDEQAVRTVGKMMLQRMGFNVLFARDGREALRVFAHKSDEIVCVLLDMTMPHMDGEETLLELRRLDPEIIVILCSGYHEQGLTSRFAGKGLSGFIQKPYDLDTLNVKLREALATGNEGV